jgi:hypothetical protein
MLAERAAAGCALLHAIDRWLPDALVPPASRKWIYDLSRSLPEPWNTRLFECRLAADDDRVDYQLCAMKLDGVPQALRAALKSGAPVAGLGSCGDVVREWVEPGTTIHREVPVIWIEFDEAGHHAPDPFAYAIADPQFLEYLHPHRPAPPSPSPRHVRAVAQVWLPWLTHHPPEERQLDQLEACARALPEGGRLYALAAMSQRGTSDLRVVAAMPHRTVAGWLDRIGWRGDRQQLHWILESLGTVEHDRSVYIDVGERVRDAVAIDFGPLWHGTRWEPLIDRLVVAGLADADKARAAVAWRGRARIDFDSARWPLHTLRHLGIKLVASGGTVQAKAYLMLAARAGLF